MVKQITFIICDIKISFFETFAGYYIIVAYDLFNVFFNTMYYEKRKANKYFSIGCKE